MARIRYRESRRSFALNSGAPVAKPIAARAKTPIESEAPTAIVTAARRLNRAAGMIATSVLIDSAMEHYRGNFHHKAMWTPIITSLL
jgi:hypothetical protein